MRCRIAVIATFSICLLVPQAPTAMQQPNPARPRRYLKRDLDGPSGGPQFASAHHERSQALVPMIIASFDFEGTPHDPQGWTSVDRAQEAGPMFHIDATDLAGGNLDGGDFGNLAVISGNKSLWCGAAAGGGDAVCHYASLPGYGNQWEQVFVSDPIPRTPGLSVFVDFKVRFDLEAGYDKAYLEFENADGNWEPLPLETAGTNFYTGRSTDLVPGGVVHEYWGTPSVYFPPDYTRWRWRVVTDAAFSDEDGLYNSDGALIVDDLSILDGYGAVLNSEDFESEAVGDTTTTSGVWHAEVLGFGDFAALYPGTSLLQQSPPLDPADVLSTCVWSFTNGSPDDYSCGGFPAEPAVPYGSADTGYINNDIRSPWISWEPAGGQTTHLSFDAYTDLPLENGILFTIYVRQRSDAGCPTQWRGGDFVYYSPLAEQTYDLDLTRYFGPTTAGADEIQIALNVFDAELTTFAGLFPPCHTNAPLFDNVEVYLDNTHSWDVSDAGLFQDRFPTDESATGTIRADAADGADAAHFFVTEPGVGLDLENGEPAVFCHVKTLPGKAGAAISGGPGWPEVPSMSDPDWTVLQCAATGEMNEFSVDLNDNLYEPGDVVWFYFSARDANALTTYYSQFTGRVNNEADARAYPMEFTGLPTGKSNVLYVDAFSSRGAEPFFNTSFAELGIAPDRFDVRAPSSLYENHLGDVVGNPAVQLAPYYDTIIYNSGDLEFLPIKGGDFNALNEWIQNHPGPQAGLYLSGDHLASSWEASQEQSAMSFRQYCDFSVVSEDHRSVGEPTSPHVIPTGGSPFASSMMADGTGPSPGRFDVLSPGPNASVGMEYNPTNAPALVYQSTPTQNGAVNVVLSGFSYHAIRDDDDNGIPDRTEHLAEVMNYINNAVLVPTGVTPAATNRLDQNTPNPFNPTTSITYSIRESGRVTLRIYDVAGRLVRTLVDEVQPARAEGYTIDWDGRSDAGETVATGVYFYRLESVGFHQTRKMTLLK